MNDNPRVRKNSPSQTKKPTNRFLMDEAMAGVGDHPTFGPLVRARVVQSLRSGRIDLLDDVGQKLTGFGEAVEIVLPLASGRNDPAVTKQGEVVADRGLR